MHTYLDNGKLLLTYCWIKTELTRAVIPCLVCRPCKLQVENLSGQSWILRAEFLSIKFTSMASRVNLKKKLKYYFHKSSQVIYSKILDGKEYYHPIIFTTVSVNCRVNIKKLISLEVRKLFILALKCMYFFWIKLDQVDLNWIIGPNWIE